MTYFIPKRDKQTHLLASTIASINMMPAIITNPRLEHLIVCSECCDKLNVDARKRVHDYGKDKMDHLAICKTCYESLDSITKAKVQSHNRDATKRSLTLVNNLMEQRP